MAKLIEHLPPIMQQFAEMQQITAAEDKEIEHIEEVKNTVFQNAFIESCDEKGIERFERMLSIISNMGDDLELRRARVAVRWNDGIPYTYFTLKKSLNSSLGESNYELIADQEHYYILLQLKLNVADRLEIVRDLLKCILPENVGYEIMLIYNTHAVLSRFTHEQLHNYTHKQLREEALS